MKMDIKYADPVPPTTDRGYGQTHRLEVELKLNFAEEIDKAVAALNVLKTTLPAEKGDTQ